MGEYPQEAKSCCYRQIKHVGFFAVFKTDCLCR